MLFYKVIKREELTDEEILRTAIIAELDAANLYEGMARITKSSLIRKVLLDIAKEEKTHVGEFQDLLLEIDPEQKVEIEEGSREVEEIKKEVDGLIKWL